MVNFTKSFDKGRERERGGRKNTSFRNKRKEKDNMCKSWKGTLDLNFWPVLEAPAKVSGFIPIKTLSTICHCICQLARAPFWSSLLETFTPFVPAPFNSKWLCLHTAVRL